MIGTTLGPYRILDKLGSGGMGEVYRARDTKLHRDVALKVLPAAVTNDGDRLARFRREAEVLASLNHPNITGIYGFEDAGEIHALIMELVEGEDLSAHIARGPMALADTLAIARQIVDALEAAHEQGVIHRDLKPANVKVRADGTVKVLDFGLAKALAPAGSSATADAMNSPTLTAAAIAGGYGAPGTQMGMILGTAAYMAPEQAVGKPVDKRADIWAFGCVLYEMLAGTRTFVPAKGSGKAEAESVVEILAAVLRQDVDLAALPASTPPALRRLIGRCLVRDPRQRLRDIGDARFDLDAAEREPDAPSSAAPARASSSVLVGALGILAITSATLAAWLLLSRQAPAVPLQLSIALPEEHNLASGPAISRDGRLVAWVSSDGVARPQLYVRALDQPEARMLPGTEEAAGPFFSPDGRSIAFYARNKLFKVSVDGGAPVELADSMSNAGGTWTDAGTIIFKRTWNGALHVIDENGGKREVLIAPDSKEEYAYTWPYAVPGGSEVYFASWGKEFNIIRLDTATQAKRAVSPGWRRIVVTPAGYLIGAGDGGELKAVFLGPAANERGPIVTVLENLDVGTVYGDARFDISQTGTLAYVPAARIARRVVTVDRQGRSAQTSLPEDEYDELRLSASGRRAAVVSNDKLGILDLDRGTVTPLVPELGTGARSGPVWSIDGQTITFASNHEGNWEIYSKAASGAGGIVPVLRMPLDQFPHGFAPDGTLLFQTTGPDSGADLWLRDPKGTARAWVATMAEEIEGRFSPDGRVIAYSSNASGRFEIYIQSRDNPTDRLQVSATGGETPAWSPLGNRVFFRRGTAMMEATVSTSGGKLSASVPVQVFNSGWVLRPLGYDVAPGGDSFVMIEQPQEAIRKRIDIVLNWFSRLEEKMRRR